MIWFVFLTLWLIVLCIPMDICCGIDFKAVGFTSDAVGDLRCLYGIES